MSLKRMVARHIRAQRNDTSRYVLQQLTFAALEPEHGDSNMAQEKQVPFGFHEAVHAVLSAAPHVLHAITDRVSSTKACAHSTTQMSSCTPCRCHCEQTTGSRNRLRFHLVYSVRTANPQTTGSPLRCAGPPACCTARRPPPDNALSHPLQSLSGQTRTCPAQALQPCSRHGHQSRTR